ncbi:DUF2786 domain-containing protein [Mixta tenebrionis]|jgi:hypothetical protein|uniref:Uncharacterized protein n=2 Tax=Mixta TaxID=2100764 RepID=A0A6P1Q118_9GAMM|nr:MULTISPECIES: DUF2786 domain-containing protein [Mixta]QHM72660.1 hypothetical protein C7M51_02978 [Mixta intestinalis]TPW40879.1 DUF2786 domain-containing protein [Mixta tenebrionis]
MMNNTRQERLVSLVRKLLDLSRRNSNPHEAGLALSRAQRLMKQYGITEQEAGLSAIRKAPTQGAPSNAEKVPAWQESLVWAINHAFGCRAYYSWREANDGTYRRIVVFYGTGERPEVAAYAWDVLCRQLKDATTAYLKTQNKRLKLATRRHRADQFRAGWVCGVRRVISTFHISEQEVQLMENWMNNQNMKTATLRDVKDCRGSDLARQQGIEAGKNARLNHAVGGRGPVGIGYRAERS